MPTGVYKRSRRVQYIPITCRTCGVVREFSPGVVRQRKVIKFCSKTCEGLSRRTAVDVACVVCKTIFSKRADKVSDRNFCDRRCSAIGRTKADAKWKDPAYIKIYMANYNQANKDKLRLQKRQWFQNNKDKKAAVQRARRFGTTSAAFPAAAWADMKEFYNFACLACRKREPEITLTQDHIIAFKNGGTHEPDNIQPLCFSCNRRKSTTSVDYRPAGLET